MADINRAKIIGDVVLPPKRVFEPLPEYLCGSGDVYKATIKAFNKDGGLFSLFFSEELRDSLSSAHYDGQPVACYGKLVSYYSHGHFLTKIFAKSVRPFRIERSNIFSVISLTTGEVAKTPMKKNRDEYTIYNYLIKTTSDDNSHETLGGEQYYRGNSPLLLRKGDRVFCRANLVSKYEKIVKDPYDSRFTVLKFSHIIPEESLTEEAYKEAETFKHYVPKLTQIYDELWGIEK